MNDGTGLAEAMLGLDGFRVLEVSETPDELVIQIDTVITVVGCAECGTRPKLTSACLLLSAIWPASDERRDWCGTSDVGVAWTPTARPGRGRRPRRSSRPERC